MGKEYLVNGAKLMCLFGEGTSELRVTKEHGYKQKGKAKANCGDCVAGVNIPYFKACKMNQETHLCKGHMRISHEWESMTGISAQMEKVDGKEALTMDSVLICDQGGLILPVTSGQDEMRGINRAGFVKRYSKALRWVKGKNPGFQISRIDPVNMNTGNFIYEKEELVIPGITTLSFMIFYNSMDKGGGSIGKGWRHNHEMHIRREKDGMLYICRGDGKDIPYRPLVSGMYAPVMGDKGLLAEDREGFRYVDGTGDEYAFDREGILLSKKDRSGNTDTYTHNSKGQLTCVRGANGGELYYTYNKEGYLIRVNDHTGREVCLWYRYGKLWKFVNASGYAYLYEYNAAGWLESVQTPRGIVGLVNEYDSEGRVLKQTMPDGSIAEMQYDDSGMSTYLKETDGSMTCYESDDRCRNIRTVHEDGEERFEYNDRNLCTLYVDKNGNQTRYSYDDKGNLTGITNALGEKQEFTYDREGRMLTASAGGKMRVRNIYDVKGRLAESADALGRSRRTVYGKGLPVQLTLPDGSSFKILRDGRGNVETVTDPYGGETSYAYDDLNRVVSSTDAEGNTTSYRYDERNHLTGVTNPEGYSRTYTYNESGKLVRMEDYDGNTLSISYNAMGKPEKLTDKEGRQTRRAYDVRGNLSEETSPSGAVTGFLYDKNNRLKRVETRKDKDGGTAAVVEYAYDPVGNLLRTQAGDGKAVLSETSYTYDALNRVMKITNPTGGETFYTYDGSGHVVSITDPAGNQSSFVYNEAGELTEETDIRGNTVRYEYNLLGQLSAVTDGAGRKTRHFYLPGGRLERTVYPDGNQVSYVYDKLGRIISRTDGQGYRLEYAYDSMGRVTAITSSAGQEKRYTYDVLGNVTSMNDANGNTTFYEYTLSGKLKAVIDALGNRAEYVYDNEDRLIHICQKGNAGEANRETFYERNPFGQVECIRDALGNEEHYEYDALGRVALKTDRDGYRTAYDYTADGKVSRILYGDGSSVEMEYTALRQLSLVKDWLGETQIERDVMGDPVSITDHNGKTVSYEWGSMGERKGITYPDGKRVRYLYDDQLRLEKMQIEKSDSLSGMSSGMVTGGFEEIRYRYDKMGRLSEKCFPEGMRTMWQYDGRGQLTELVHEDERGTLDRYRYEYDLMGNKTAITKERRGLQAENGRYEYGYDALSRLVSVSKDGKSLRNYAYDAFGNRSSMEEFEKKISTAYTYDILNHLISKEERRTNTALHEGALYTEYFYDNRGNLIREEREGKQVQGYKYGVMNRLTKSWNIQGQEAYYKYNGLGQRTGRNVGGREEKYLLDFTKLYDNLLGVEKEENWQRFYFDWNVVAMDEERSEAKTPERMVLPGLHYYIQDELGSTLRVSDFRKEERLFGGRSNYLVYGYDEFGNDMKNESEELGISNLYDGKGKDQPFGYTGYRYDKISGTYFAQAREYKSSNGRFNAEDAIKGFEYNINTQNLYNYCFQNPILFVDKKGYYPDYTSIGEMLNNAMTEIGEIMGDTVSDISSTVGNATKQIYETAGNTVGTIGNSVGILVKDVGKNFGYPWNNENIGNAINATGEYMGGSIKATGNLAGNCMQIVGDLAGNEIKRSSRVYGMISQDIINNNVIKGVVTVGVAGSIGAGGKLTLSAQKAFDTRGNTQRQVSVGAGIVAGEGGSGELTIAVYPRLENVLETEGFSTIIGLSGGLGLFGSIDLVFSGEGLAMHPVGISFALGAGEGLEFHVYMTGTKGGKVKNIFDSFWNSEYIE